VGEKEKTGNQNDGAGWPNYERRIRTEQLAAACGQQFLDHP
jgi:hypothetical protein